MRRPPKRSASPTYSNYGHYLDPLRGPRSSTDGASTAQRNRSHVAARSAKTARRSALPDASPASCAARCASCEFVLRAYDADGHFDETRAGHAAPRTLVPRRRSEASWSPSSSRTKDATPARPAARVATDAGHRRACATSRSASAGTVRGRRAAASRRATPCGSPASRCRSTPTGPLRGRDGAAEGHADRRGRSTRRGTATASSSCAIVELERERLVRTSAWPT